MTTISTRRLTFMVASITALAPLAIDAYLPAMPALASQVGASIHLTSISISVFLAGFALGQLIFGPLSDRLGRRPVLIAGITTFLVASLGLVMMNSLSSLFFWRFVQALGGGACVVNSPAIVRDRFSGAEASRVLSTMVMLLMLAPLVAPSLGSALLYLGGWQLIFVFLMAYALAVLFMVMLGLPETSKRPQSPPTALQVLKNYRDVVTHRAALGYMFTCALSFAGMFAFITSSPYVYLEYYRVSPAVYPFLFGANIVVMAGSNRLNMLLVRHYRPRAVMKAGLAVQLLAALMLSTVILLRLDSVIVIMLLVMCFVGTAGLINPNAVSAMLDNFPNMSATANAVLGCLQFSFGALSGGIVSILALPGAGSMAAMMLFASIMANTLVRWLSERRMQSPRVNQGV